MRIATVLLLALAILALPACQMNERLSGTAFGAGGGVLLGALAAETLAGALVGGLAGGVVGYLIGDYIADQRERACCPTQNPCNPCPQPCAPGYGGYPQSGYGQPRVGAVKAVDGAWQASQAAIARGKRAPTLPQARADYEEAVRLDARNPEAWNALGLTHLMGGDRSSAERAFRQALAVDPNHYAAKQNLAWATNGVR